MCQRRYKYMSLNINVLRLKTKIKIREFSPEVNRKNIVAKIVVNFMILTLVHEGDHRWSLVGPTQSKKVQIIKNPKKIFFSDMKQIKLFENGTATLKISELAIGNLMVLMAGLLGYLTGFLRGNLGESKGQFQGSDEDNAYHSHGEFRRKILGTPDQRMA